MNILILDDDENRHRGFIGAFRGSAHKLTHAWTSQEANSRLHGCSGEPRFDVVFLDHDLGEFGEHSLGTGLHVAREVAALPKDRAPTLVVVHSHNPDGAHAMMRVLAHTDIPTERMPYCDHLLNQCRIMAAGPDTLPTEAET